MLLKLQNNSDQELYSANQPPIAAHNLIIGKLYVEAVGKVKCINHSTNEVCDIEFKERGWNGKNANISIGLIKR